MSGCIPEDITLGCRWERLRRLQRLADRLEELICLRVKEAGEPGLLSSDLKGQMKFDAGVVREYRYVIRAAAEEVGQVKPAISPADEPVELAPWEEV